MRYKLDVGEAPSNSASESSLSTEQFSAFKQYKFRPKISSFISKERLDVAFAFNNQRMIAEIEALARLLKKENIDHPGDFKLPLKVTVASI